MKLQTIIQNAAKNIGLRMPASAQGDDADTLKLVQFVNETGEELARRVNWNSLTKRHIITGSGDNSSFALAADHARLSDGLCVTSDGMPVRGGLSSDEWLSIKPIDGTPRIFRTENNNINFYPYPAAGQTVRVSYQSAYWARNAAGTSKDSMALNDDTAVFSHALITQGVVWRFLRNLGKDYSDYMAEYEAALADYARAENGERQP